MLLEKAIKIASIAHTGQKDKAGEPYILHPLQVMMRCRHNEIVRVIAVLHDVVEDSNFTLEDLRWEFDSEIVDAIDCLTRRKDEKYFDYIRRVKTNELAAEVKLIDLHHNTDLIRLSAITQKDIERNNKYKKAIDILLSKEDSE